MAKTPKFIYENGHAVCEVRDQMGRIFKGEAWCAEDDKDFESMLTGSTIAEMRAQIAAAKTYRDDLKIRLGALNQLYYNMEHSKHFNPKSYEAQMLFKQINLIKSDLEIAVHQLAVLKLDLHEYLMNKDDLYVRLRKNREHDSVSANK